MSRFASILLGLLVAAPAVPAAAQSDSGAYVVMLGADTVSVESYARRGNLIEGTIVRRSPRVTVVRYTLSAFPAGNWTLSYNTRLPDGTMPPNGATRVAVRATGNDLSTTFVRDTATPPVNAQVVNPFPEIAGHASFYRVAIARLDALGVDSADFHAYPAGAREGEYSPVAKRGPNRYWVYSFGSPIEITTNVSGDVVLLDGSRTTVRTKTTRIPFFDVTRLAVAWAGQERAVGTMGPLSPNDSMVATVAGARVRIEYGRPAVRGRTVWGPTGVLGDSIWRTGANASTKFITDAPVTLGGTRLPTGRYVLTTLAIPGRYQLIVSQEDKEIARIPLTATPITPSVERFTIAIEGGRLRLRWATQELSVPIT